MVYLVRHTVDLNVSSDVFNMFQPMMRLGDWECGYDCWECGYDFLIVLNCVWI